MFKPQYRGIWASQVMLVVNNPPANAGDIRDAGSTPGSGRSPGGRHGNPFQYSCLENPRDRGLWWALVHRVTKSQTWLIRLSIPRWLRGKESICQRRRLRQHGFNPWVGKIPWRGHDNPLQYPCFKNPRGRGLWQATVHEVAKSRTQLMNWACREIFKSPPTLPCVHWNNEDAYPLAVATYSVHGTNGNKTYHLKICIPIFQLCTFF